MKRLDTSDYLLSNGCDFGCPVSLVGFKNGCDESEGSMVESLEKATESIRSLVGYGYNEFVIKVYHPEEDDGIQWEIER